MKNYDYILVELKAPSGHVNLYRNQIESLLIKGKKILFVTTKLYSDFFSNLDIDFLIFDCNHTNNKVFHRIQQCHLLLKLKIKLTQLKYQKLVFLSYENMSFCFLSRIFDENTYVVEHNNIDFIIENKIKRLSYNLTSKLITHVVFEDYISDFIVKEFGKKTKIIAHPVNRYSQCSKVSNFNYIFCPSSDTPKAFLDRLLIFCERNNLVLITKDKYKLKESEFLIQKNFFENYDEVFVNASYIAIGVDFKYRISAVFYEAISNNKKIIMSDSLFSQKMISKYKSSSIQLLE